MITWMQLGRVLTLSKYDGRLVPSLSSQASKLQNVTTAQQVIQSSSYCQAQQHASTSQMLMLQICRMSMMSRGNVAKVRLQNMLEACRHWTKLIEGEKELVT